ncbi:hypothetical protein OROMI_011484 [Orobanche minor]
MEYIFVAVMMMVVVFSLIPLYLWRRRLDSRRRDQHEKSLRIYRIYKGKELLGLLIRGICAEDLRLRRPARTLSAAVNVEETLDGSDDEEDGHGYHNAKASKKKENKRQEREAERQKAGPLEEEAIARKAKEEEAAALEFEKWRRFFR